MMTRFLGSSLFPWRTALVTDSRMATLIQWEESASNPTWEDNDSKTTWTRSTISKLLWMSICTRPGVARLFSNRGSAA
jgi:hypothetical protein